MQAFGRLLTIMDQLREHCPWDKKQTLESLRHLTIEEVYELADAITNSAAEEIKKELGDLLLHICFYARIGTEQGFFDMEEVINTQCEKIISRHPHIYGTVQVADEEEVKRNWEKLKLKEGNKSILQGVPVSLPAMVKATRIQEKARGAGFDWEQADQVLLKVHEELAELKAEIASGNQQNVEGELGDLFFSIINYARFLNIDPEQALEKTNKKFIKRFQYLEACAQKEGKQLADMTLAEMDVYWNEAKGL